MSALPAVLRVLAGEVDPDEVVRRLCEGPLAALEVVSGLLYIVDGDELILVGEHAIDPEWIDLFRVVAMPRGIDPLLTAPGREVAEIFDAWEHTWTVPHVGLREVSVAHPSRPRVTVLPITGGERIVGLLIVASQRAWVPEADEAQALGAALGVWAAHPASQVAETVGEVRQLARPMLTARQVDVLRLVDAGWSTDEIAAALHLAASTVKADVRVALQVFAVDDRREAARRAREIGAFGGVGGGEVPGGAGG